MRDPCGLVLFILILTIQDGRRTFALLHPQFGCFGLLLLSLLLQTLADFLVGEPVHLLAGLVTVDHLVTRKDFTFTLLTV